MSRQSQLRVVDPVLTTLLHGYTNAEFVGINLFPFVPVKKEAGKIPKFGVEHFKAYNTERALRANSNRLPAEARTTHPFTLTEHDASYPIDYREAQEDILNTEQFGAFMAQSAVMLRHELVCAELATTVANFPVGNKIELSGTGQWTHASSNPIKTVRDAVEAIRKKIVKRPNTMILSAQSFAALQDHSLITDRIKYSQLGVVTVDLLKGIFGIPNIYVADAVKANDKNVVSDIWGDNTVIAYVAPAKSNVSRSVFEPSFGYTLRKEGMPEADKYEEEGGKVTLVRSTDNYTVEIVGASAGYLIADTNG